MKITALNGIHTAGKTSIGRMLEKREGYTYLIETAEKVIDSIKDEGDIDGDTEFQRKIHRKEIKRDRKLLDKDLEHILIEIWHTGNIAHSMEVAKKEFVEEQKKDLKEKLEKDRFRIHAVFLDIEPEKVWYRSEVREEGDTEILRFYRKVKENHFKLYRELGIPYSVVDNNGNIEETYQRVKEIIENPGQNSNKYR
ncbi:MAG: ATP-binding protein [Candidatus Nanohaloarchaeota archaeon QJJ-9]|nr:ATP-binding protein [Candidatus Nanohaloarchaeota archaeon QJJ-9]